ncbi:MAG: NAD+ synthase [Burkholderiaceae bacterium]|nr:NAD+ synthase [Burkholderiaceae bacterium]
MLIAAAQLNLTVGDFAGNVAAIVAAARSATEQGARVLVTPELAISGYPPEDLLLRGAFYAAAARALQQLLAQTAELDIFVVCGAPVERSGGRFNAAVVAHRGTIVGECHKQQLPNYEVFDERRYFEAGTKPLVFTVDGIAFGVLVCEDLWYPGPPEQARSAGADALLVLNASPFHLDKQHRRIGVAYDNATAIGLPVMAVNLVGGQDELVFDGLSFALDARGKLVAQAHSFAADLLLVEVKPGNGRAQFATTRIEPVPGLEEQTYAALVVGVRDYVDKNGFPGAIIGLSGGIDSALTMAIAVDALGAERVRAVMMPSPYTAEISWIDARDMALRLGVRYDELPIGECMAAFDATLAEEFRGLAADTTEENIQARIRGTLLMALSNKHGSIVLTTGNKSEFAVGYCTLYGDMAGGFAVIKDIAKTMVYRLSRWRNRTGEVIPERIINRAPSAELRPDQTDQDSLPPYEVLDAIMQMYIEQNRSVAEILATGLPGDAVERVVRLIQLNEYKRRQAPVGIRVTHRAFGRDWRYPITSKFRDVRGIA